MKQKDHHCDQPPGIGAGITTLFLDRGYNVVGNSRHISVRIAEAIRHLALIDGDIGQTARRSAW